MTQHIYDAEGRHVDDGHVYTMRVFSGRHVDPMHVRVEDVDIRDIAHALARQCRFNGHCAGYLSVARHCIDVSHRLEHLGPLVALQGLLHDAAETWLGDMTRPMKHSGAFAAYFVAEEIAERSVADVYDLPYPWPDAVKDADNASVVDELENLWDNPGSPTQDEYAFLDRFRELRIRL
jgi:hypothetical protein